MKAWVEESQGHLGDASKKFPTPVRDLLPNRKHEQQPWFYQNRKKVDRCPLTTLTVHTAPCFGSPSSIFPLVVERARKDPAVVRHYER